jgi:hypothetical protein
MGFAFFDLQKFCSEFTPLLQVGGVGRQSIAPVLRDFSQFPHE